MAFAKSSNFTINHSKFVDKSTIKQITASDSKNQSGDGLQRLLNAVSTDASFDSQARYPPPRCDENTRRALITHILQWIDSGKEDILFLHGPAGAGKSAIAQTVASACAETQTLAGSYFFFRGSPSRNTMTPLIPTITYDMTSSAPRKRRKVERVVKGNPSILSKSPEFQLHKLILEPHRRSLILRVFWIQKKRRLLIIDGLDECNNDRDQRRVVELLGQLSDKKRGVVRCLIASRPEPQILSAMNSLPTNIRVTRVTLNEESWDANKDIYAYFRSHFDEISSRLPLSIPRPWPSDEIIETLVQKAGGIFIYASTVVKYVDDQDSLPTIQLEHVLKLSPGTTPFAELDMLYQQILTACPSRHLSTLLHIFGFIFLRNPGLEEFYDVSLIEALLDLSPGEVAVVLRRMHSILTITTTGSRSSISFLHASFGDFIFNRERSGQYFIDRESEQLFLATRCIDCMGRHGRQVPDNISTHDGAMMYAWNSWPYHGRNAAHSFFMNFIAYLRDCDKISWIKALPELHYRSCTDGLDVGLTWLERCSTKSPAHANPLDLQIVIKELSRKLFESILVYPNSSLEMLGVFEDPGIDFFDLAADYVVSLTPDDTPPTFLYFGYQGKAHDLEWWDAFLVSKALGEPLRRWANYHPDSVALCCISWMKNPETRTNFGLQYATKYWTKHVTLSNKNNHDILSSLGETELRDAPPEQQVTLADVVILTQWLEGSPLVQQERQELLSLWEGHSRELESNPNLGLCSAQWKKRLAGVWPEGAWKKYDHDHSTSESPKMWGGAWGTGGWGRLQGGGV